MTKQDLEDLFNYMSNDHDVILLDQDIAEIETICNRELEKQNKELTEIKNYHKNGFNKCLDKIAELEKQIEKCKYRRLASIRLTQYFRDQNK